MKKINTKELFSQMEKTIAQHIDTASGLLNESDDLLNTAPAPGKWSVVQVFEHLNSYGMYYLPAMEKAIAGKNTGSKEFYTPGWLGNYFTNLMKPGPAGVSNKMKAPKGHRPATGLDSRKVLLEFIGQQQHLRLVINQAAASDPGKIRVPTSLSPVIKLKLGDTLRFLLAHQERHFVQIANALKAIATHGKYQEAHLAV